MTVNTLVFALMATLRAKKYEVSMHFYLIGSMSVSVSSKEGFFNSLNKKVKFFVNSIGLGLKFPLTLFTQTLSTVINEISTIKKNRVAKFFKEKKF